MTAQRIPPIQLRAIASYERHAESRTAHVGDKPRTHSGSLSSTHGPSDSNEWPVHLQHRSQVPRAPSATTSHRPPPRPDLGDYTFNVMAPLVIGDPHDMESPASQAAWREFEVMLKQAKANGAEAVSTDVWWGLIEPKDNQFDWDKHGDEKSYYDRVADTIEAAGLCWAPILSFHQCGGNVGDDAYVPIPSFLDEKYRGLGEDGPYARSEQGNVCRESVSVWASKAAGNEFEDVMRSFQAHFADRAGNISEINISLGPAGELRYPSYNTHDQNAGYPTRGALQSYSSLAIDNFRKFAVARYGSVEAVNQAWGAHLSSVDDIRPPDDVNGFFGRHDDVNTQYGRDLFDWYNESLVEHGHRLMTTAIDVFNGPDAPFRGIDLGAKVPGIHWRIGLDRAAELDAGLIRSSTHDRWTQHGHGYEDIVSLFSLLQDRPNAPKVVLHFTCLEMDDGNGGPAVASRAKSLVGWIARTAKQYGVHVKGENALPVGDSHQWHNIEDAIRDGYEGLTVLRLPLSEENLRHLSYLSATYQ